MKDQKKRLGKSSNKSKGIPKKWLYVLIVVIFILAEGLVLYADSIPDSNSANDSNSTIALNKKEAIIVGNNSIGTVSVEGPYGNTSSPVKIAYILGQHPRESNAHESTYNNLLKSSDNLSYSYYIYKINVTSNRTDFEESRMNGQLLAQEFVVPAVVQGGYKLAIDVHSSNGAYFPDPYIFAPTENDTVSNQSAHKLVDQLNWLYYYTPTEYSSPQYCTQPITGNGTPSLVFEIHGDPTNSVDKQANDFIHAVDKLTFS